MLDRSIDHVCGRDPVRQPFAVETGSADELMQRGLVAASARRSMEDALVAWKEAAQLYEQAGHVPGQIQALT